MSVRAEGGTVATLLGALMVACCMAGPAVVGAVAGGAVGGWLDVPAAVAVAFAVAAALWWRRRRRGAVCRC